MKLELVMDGQRRALDLDESALAGGSCAFMLDAVAGRADVRPVSPGVYSILIGGRSLEVRLETEGQRLYASVNGERYTIEVRDPRRLSRVRAALEAAGRQKISSPMPGKVVRILAREGDQVIAGQGLVVVEAMKMQNEIRSPKSGRVAAMAAVEGATVAGGETLAEVE